MQNFFHLVFENTLKISSPHQHGRYPIKGPGGFQEAKQTPVALHRKASESEMRKGVSNQHFQQHPQGDRGGKNQMKIKYA